jgi:hypothetical protein
MKSTQPVHAGPLLAWRAADREAYRCGLGRIYVSVYGHLWFDGATPPRMRRVALQTLMPRALKWRARRDPVAQLPADFPGLDAPNSGSPDCRFPSTPPSRTHRKEGISMRHSPWTTTLVAILGLVSAGTAGAQTPDPAKLEQVVVAGKKTALSAWVRAESQRFVVYSDADQTDVGLLLENLEKLDGLLRLYIRPQHDAGRPEPKLTLYYYSQATTLGEVAGRVPADAVGLYSSCASGVQGFAIHVERVPRLTDEELDRSPLDETLTHVFEAYTRHFLYGHTDIRLPTSFIDGFARYFSTVRFSAGQMVIGRMPTLAAQYLGLLSKRPAAASLEYADVLEENLSQAHNAAGPGGARLEFEIKSWLLTHYMLSSPDNRQRLGRYIALVHRGVSSTTAFEHAYGLKAGDLGKLMGRYSLNKINALRVVPPALPVARASFRVLPQAAGEFVLVNAALKACPSRPDGEALLQKVAALAARYPGDEQARLTLSRAQIDWGQPTDALPALSVIVKDDDAHFEASYLLGLAHLRLAERNEDGAGPAHLQAAQEALRRARALNPQSPETALALFKAEVRGADQPRRETLDGIIAAWQTAREVDPLAQSAALAYAWTGQANDAHRALESLARNPRDKGSAPWARQWQARLEQGVTRGDLLAEMRGNAAPDAPLKEWTVDQRDVMQVLDLITELETEVGATGGPTLGIGNDAANASAQTAAFASATKRQLLEATKARRKLDYRKAS